jgi:hypothetical protein
VRYYTSVGLSLRKFCVTQPDPEEELPRALLGVLDVVLLEPKLIRWLTLV